ncbi:MAG: dihydroxy-acid dehydratase [Limimaricola sp.]|uniref:dihydroxy-acid dehydratase n=1 Tax=Limimaricola sp. TaxID=2211665 RepID=UPI001DADE094|nr:dihydroxy-acid dehydratase [Limimaricola sp.]MBI1418750.1 dihydroxy-acid dehydratase [Limimaricola sp.]
MACSNRIGGRGAVIWAALTALVLALAGCDGLHGPQVTQVAVMDGALTVAGPRGFCVDTAASRPAMGFVVLGGCAVVAGDGPMPDPAGLITVQVGGAGSAAVTGNEAALDRLLTSPQGTALLSAGGQPGSVRVHSHAHTAGLVRVRFTDGTAADPQGVQPGEWRAFLDLGGRMVTVSLRGLARAPLSAGEGQRLLLGAVAALRAANAGNPASTG